MPDKLNKTKKLVEPLKLNLLSQCGTLEKTSYLLSFQIHYFNNVITVIIIGYNTREVSYLSNGA